jgi:two-component system, LytTR family, sensor histidine kinase AlgZ
MPNSAPVSRKLDIVIPDCCNAGVVFRVLVAVNGSVLAGILLQAGGWRIGLQRFVEASILVEIACLSSLLALCGTRRIIRTIPPWGQRIACACVPAAVTSVVVRFLALSDLTHLTPYGGMLIAGLFGILLQHYFELRTLAFSPALAEARLQALQARIRPHFLFNSLNAVLSLIRTEPRRAETTLEDLADLFRVLMRDARDITSLDDEIRLCKQYLSIEKVRLGERLQVQWDTTDVSDDVLHKARIPSLLLQPLLENAVHYGVEPAREPVTIQVHIGRTIDRIEIAVINPVVADGADRQSQGNHMALDNIRERLALRYDVEGQLTTSEARGMFEVRLRFPYAKGD